MLRGASLTGSSHSVRLRSPPRSWTRSPNMIPPSWRSWIGSCVALAAAVGTVLAVAEKTDAANHAAQLHALLDTLR